MGINNKPVDMSVLKLAYQMYDSLWMEFVTRCSEFLDVKWFYEGAGFSDEKAIEMRRLVACWTLLYGTDVVKVMLPHIDYQVAKRCHDNMLHYITGHVPTLPTGMQQDACVHCMVSIFEWLAIVDITHVRQQGLIQRLIPFNLNAVTTALSLTQHPMYN